MIFGISMAVSESQMSLLEDEDDEVLGFEDYKGCPLQRTKSGGWTSGAFILGAASLEKFAYYGIESNIINYFTGHLGESTATAAAIANTWIGLNWIVPIFGAVVADSFLGRVGTIIITSILYILGLGALTLLTFRVPSSQGSTNDTAPVLGPSTELQVLIFFSLSLVTLAQGFKPCVQAFGADQFDSKNPKERKAKSSFFNWWFCGGSAGGVVAHMTLHYVQDYISWTLGFGIPCLTMVVAVFLFILGTPTYRFVITVNKKSKCDSSSREEMAKLAKAVSFEGADGSVQCAILRRHGSKIKKYMKVILKVIPIWATCLSYGIAFAQGSTFFTKQGNTMDKSVGKNLVLPAASLRTFLPLSTVILTPIYDGLIIPVSRKITRNPSGITMLQRIGTGLALCVVTMSIAAMTESKRLETAKDHGLIDDPHATVPMSFWWLVPQYLLFGVADIFALVGMQEFFYDQVPSEMRSVGLSLYLSAIGVGNFCSSFIISLIQSVTGGNGRHGWLDDNLNQGHLDYFYWLLAGIVGVGLISFVIFARAYNLEETSELECEDVS